MSITLTWLACQSIRCASTSAASLAADQVPAVEPGAVEAAQERADRAGGDVAAPVRTCRPRGDRRSGRRARRRSERRSACRAGPAAGPRRESLGCPPHERSSCCSTRETRSAIWLRSSPSSANRNRSSRSRTTSRTVQKYEVTPRLAAAGVGHRDRRSPLDGRPQPNRLERPGGEPERGVVGPVLVGQPRVGLVEEQQVLALDVEDQRLGVGRLVAEHVTVEERVEQEARVGRLGGDAGDAGDVHVRAAAAVEERQVDVDRAGGRARRRPPAAPPSCRSRGPRRAPRPSFATTASPGRGGT